MKLTILHTISSNLKNFFKRSVKAVSNNCAKFNDACHYYAKILFTSTRTSTPKKRKKSKVKKYCILILFLCLTILILYKSIFIVPVSDTGVILRLGKYQRDAFPGLHFKLPFLEQYYIVDTGNVHQETFGFLQVAPPILPIKSNRPESKTIDETKKRIKNQASDNGSAFSQKGNLIKELQGEQPLTHSYIREKLSGMYDQTVQKAKNRLAYQKNYINNIIQSGSSLNGRYPVNHELNYITTDLNIIRIKWVLQYTITNPEYFLFHADDTLLILKNISLSMMNQVIAQHYYRGILSTDRFSIENEVEDLIQSNLNALKLGLTVKNVIILDALPVPEVTPAFNEVNKASQEMESIIFKAQKSYLSAIPESKGLAKKIISEAKAKALMIVNKAQGEADQFTALLTEYRKAPEITKKRLYLEAMDIIFSTIPSTIVDNDINGMLPIFMSPTPSAQAIPPSILPSAVLSQAKSKQTTKKKSALSRPQGTTNKKTVLK